MSGAPLCDGVSVRAAAYLRPDVQTVNVKLCEGFRKWRLQDGAAANVFAVTNACKISVLNTEIALSATP